MCYCWICICPTPPGLSFGEKARDIEENILCIFMTAFPEIKTAVTAMRNGAFDYINKPFELDEMRIIVDKALEVKRLKEEVQSLRYERDSRRRSIGMLGQSSAMKHVEEQIYQVADADQTPVMILGESGTGKELVADAIHNLSVRKDNAMLKLNCSSIPETLLESELFGYDKGAFTDAKQNKPGMFELSDTGCIFLDEIGDMSISLQPKLLRVLESGSIRRLGGSKDIDIDTRIISATNQNLFRKVQDGSFRSDLIYRLNVFTIHLPPLRERMSDVPLLARHFLEESKRRIKKDIVDFDNKAIEEMKKYTWPGNIRELRNVVERACILAKSRIISAKDCALDATFSYDDGYQQTPIFSICNNWVPLSDVEYLYIKSVLEHCGGNKSEAARQLGISRVTLREKLKKPNMAENSEGKAKQPL